MATIDVRDMEDSVVNTIVFADTHGKTADDEDILLAHKLSRNAAGNVMIEDTVDYVLITDKERALHLIKALNKAIELGWLV